jgi:hypothetical protein
LVPFFVPCAALFAEFFASVPAFFMSCLAPLDGLVADGVLAGLADD